MTKLTGLQATYFGDSGGATSTSYYVQAVFPDGLVSPIAGPATVTTPAALSAGNIVQVLWAPVPGAVGYNVFKNTTGVTPVGAGAFGMIMKTPNPSFTDRGQASLTVTVPVAKLTNTTAIDTATLTLAQTLNALLIGTPTAAAAYTTPTAAAILLALGDFIIGQVAGILTIRNTSAGAFTITLTGGASVTIVGTATVVQNFTRSYYIVPTSATAVSFISLETAAH